VVWGHAPTPPLDPCGPGRQVGVGNAVDCHIATGFSKSNLTRSAGEGIITGQRVADTRASTLDQSTARQLDGIAVDRTFTDSASGKDVNRPQLAALLGFVREGDTVVTHSMGRLARNLDDLRRIVRQLTGKGGSKFPRR